MKFIGKFIIYIISNTIAILVASYFVDGFIFSGDFVSLIVTAIVFTIIQMFIRPILKLFFGPFIVLTFGIFSIVINAAILYILDILSLELTIQGYLPLLIATIVISAVHIIIDFAGRRVYKS